MIRSLRPSKKFPEERRRILLRILEIGFESKNIKLKSCITGNGKTPKVMEAIEGESIICTKFTNRIIWLSSRRGRSKKVRREIL